MKTIYKFKYLVLSIIAMLLLTSCEEKIDIKLDDESVRLVVEGNLSDSAKVHTVKLTQSSNYFSNEEEPLVTGAVLTISDGTTIFNLNEVTPGIYQSASNVKGEIGKTYTLKISLKNAIGGYKEYEASSVMKNNNQLDSLTFREGGDQNSPGGGHNIENKVSINVWAFEPATIDDYYMWKYYVNGKNMSDTLKNATFTDDLIVNGNYIPGLTVFVSDKIKIGDTITVETMGITKDYYNYIMGIMQLTEWNGGSFSGPPTNPKNNINNGALGYFNVYSSSRVSTIVKTIEKKQ